MIDNKYPFMLLPLFILLHICMLSGGVDILEQLWGSTEGDSSSQWLRTEEGHTIAHVAIAALLSWHENPSPVLLLLQRSSHLTL